MYLIIIFLILIHLNFYLFQVELYNMKRDSLIDIKVKSLK